MRNATLVLALLAIAPLTADAKPKAKAKAGAKAKAKGKSSGKAAAKVHMDLAAKAHKAGKFDEALTELQAAYEADPEPKLLFAIAQVQSKLDQCPDAIGNYEKFLATTKDKKKQSVVKQAIEACNQKVAAATPPPPTDPRPPVVATTEPPPPVASEPSANPIDSEPMPPPVDDSPLPPAPTAARNTGGGGRKPWYKDVLGDALVLTGVAAGAVSIVMYTGARSGLDDAESAGTLDEYNHLVGNAHDQRTYSVVLAGGSAVLILAGVLHYKLRDKGEARGVAIAPMHGGGLITWTGGF